MCIPARHQQYVGAVVRRVADSRALVVTTSKNILAALHPRTGAIMWRHKFNEGDVVTRDLVVCGGEVVTYHSTNRYRHWDILTGVLRVLGSSSRTIFAQISPMHT